jgi:hypothetical protein
MRLGWLSILLFVLVPFSQAQVPTFPETRVFAPYKPVQQRVDTPVTAPAEAGEVVLTIDPEVERTMTQFAETKLARDGFRVQIFLGDRRTAEETKRTFLQKNPEVPAYLSWLAPNFRLRVGDFRTRLEAERLLRDLKTSYPGSYIVPDEIDPPRLPDRISQSGDR